MSQVTPPIKHVNVIALKWEIIWTGGLPHLSGLLHLRGVLHLHVNRPLSKEHTCTKPTFPAHVVGELPCGSQPTAPTCVVWSWHLKHSPRQERVFYTRVFSGHWPTAMSCWWAPNSWRNRCPWWHGCAYAWGNGQAVGWCMCAPL